MCRRLGPCGAGVSALVVGAVPYWRAGGPRSRMRGGGDVAQRPRGPDRAYRLFRAVHAPTRLKARWVSRDIGSRPKRSHVASVSPLGWCEANAACARLPQVLRLRTDPDRTSGWAGGTALLQHESIGHRSAAFGSCRAVLRRCRAAAAGAAQSPRLASTPQGGAAMSAPRCENGRGRTCPLDVLPRPVRAPLCEHVSFRTVPKADVGPWRPVSVSEHAPDSPTRRAIPLHLNSF